MEVAPNSTGDSFNESLQVNKPDGWITPRGNFVGCKPDEHDTSALFLYEKYKEDIKKELLAKDLWHMAREGVDKYSPRELLKASGFALLTEKQMHRVNQPFTLSIYQMETLAAAGIAPNNPDTPQLPILKEFRSSLPPYESLVTSEWIGSKQNKKYVKTFLEDPTRYIYIKNEPDLTDKVFKGITENNLGEISVSLGKNSYKWRALRLNSGKTVFVELHAYDHTFGDQRVEDTGLFQEDTITLTTKEYVQKFVQRERLRIKGDMGILS